MAPGRSNLASVEVKTPAELFMEAVLERTWPSPVTHAGNPPARQMQAFDKQRGIGAPLGAKGDGPNDAYRESLRDRSAIAELHK